MSDIDEVQIEFVTDDEEVARFDRAARKFLELSGEEFAARLDAGDLKGLNQSAAMRVAILRPVEVSNTEDRS